MSLHHRMMLQRYGLACTTSLYSQVLFDPIFTPIFTALFTPIFGAGTALTSFAVGAAAAIATTALTVGLQLLLAPSVKTPKPEDGKVPKAQSIPYRWWGVGRTRIAGAYMLWEAKGPRLFSVQALTGHRIKSINRYYLHDDEVTIGAGNFVNGLPGGRYADQKVRLYSRLGLTPETAYSDIVALIPESWTSAHRGDGQASVAMIAKTPDQKNFSARFPYNAPSVSVEADLAYCWDFRDPAQDPDDESTWEWTQNCAVILAWHLCFSEFGEKLDYTKAILPVLDLWIEEADICDEDVPVNGGGTEKRYQCNGFDTTENGPKAATNAILAACDGHLVARGDGARILTVGKFRESRCGVLADADIVGHNIQYDVLFEDEINRLVPKFTYPAIDYATADTDYFEDTDAQISAGRVLAQEAEYTWVHQWRQARRLAKREWLRIQEKVRGSLDVRLSGINAVYNRWNRLETPNRLPRLNGEIIENRRALLSITRGGFTMDIVQHPENIDAWTPATDEGQQPPVPPAPNPAGLVTPVINLVQAKSNSGSVYIRVVIIDPDDDSLTPTVRYRVADAGSGNPGAWIEQQFPDTTAFGGYVDLATGTVPADELLDIQVAFISSKGKYSDWSITANITSTVDSTPPGTPINLTAPNSVTTVPVSAKAANDNTRYLIFKRGTTGQSFAAATLIGQYSVTANQTINFNDTPGAGTYKYWCGAENISGIPSASQASVTTVVT
ncbi:hypothetical protein QA644_08120 [Rhizobium sp. CC1099]|uniref:hypothetical protein n=1 Tax=Rhizobium sp. CC1099 TaxID=3039160 RepID=UPI0024B1A701|nr:hypothetical protein [Rhizobium sp. CC1099]WFU88995.1 hypothetical protein QA644_08120 [Rhizobium sp. CC1099]